MFLIGLWAVAPRYCRAGHSARRPGHLSLVQTRRSIFQLQQAWTDCWCCGPSSSGRCICHGGGHMGGLHGLTCLQLHWLISSENWVIENAATSQRCRCAALGLQLNVLTTCLPRAHHFCSKPVSNATFRRLRWFLHVHLAFSKISHRFSTRNTLQQAFRPSAN